MKKRALQTIINIEYIYTHWNVTVYLGENYHSSSLEQFIEPFSTRLLWNKNFFRLLTRSNNHWQTKYDSSSNDKSSHRITWLNTIKQKLLQSSRKSMWTIAIIQQTVTFFDQKLQSMVKDCNQIWFALSARPPLIVDTSRLPHLSGKIVSRHFSLSVHRGGLFLLQVGWT